MLTEFNPFKKGGHFLMLHPFLGIALNYMFVATYVNSFAQKKIQLANLEILV